MSHTLLPQAQAQPLTLRPYQVEGIERLKSSNTLLTDDCGLGKTVQSIYAALKYPGPKLIVCNKTAKDQWEDELWRLLGPQATILVAAQAGRLDETVLHGLASRRANFWLITHWAGVRLQNKLLSRYFWDVIIADEAHKIRNRKAQVSQALKQITARRKIALTASPDEISVGDRWSILNWLAPNTFRSYWQFFDEYAEYDLVMGGGRVVSGTRADKAVQLGQVLSPWCLGRTKAEVAPDLPPLIEQVVPIDLYDQHRTYYKKLSQGELLVPPNTEEFFIPNQLAKLTRQQQMVSDPTIFGINTPSAKWDWLADWIEGNPSQIAIILTRFRSTATRIAKQYDAALVVGQSPVHEAARFMTGKCQYLVGTVGSLKESLNLQRASTMIFYDAVWSSTDMMQAVNRVHRMNITEPKMAYYLVAQRTVDMLIRIAYTEKWTDQRLIKEWTARYSQYSEQEGQ